MGRDERNSEGSYDIMLTIILSILFWCMPEKKELGVAAIVLSVIGFLLDISLVGVWCILDILFLIINITVYNKEG